MKLDIKNFALAAGILWGLSLFLLAWWLLLIEGSTGPQSLLERVYIGYAFTPIGSVIGLGWGLVDGLIGGALFAWLYNTLVGRAGG